MYEAVFITASKLDVSGDDLACRETAIEIPVRRWKSANWRMRYPDKIQEMVTDKVKKFYSAEEIVSYKSRQEVLDTSHLPGILLLDIQMPQMDGMEAAREFCKQNDLMMIKLVTVTKDYILQSFDVGVFHFLVKASEDLTVLY